MDTTTMDTTSMDTSSQVDADRPNLRERRPGGSEREEVVSEAQPSEADCTTKRSVNPPWQSGIVTVVFMIFALLGFLVGAILLLVIGILTAPLILIPASRMTIFNMLAGIYRSAVSFFCVRLNPFWGISVVWTSTEPIPPGCIVMVNHRSNSDPFLLSAGPYSLFRSSRYPYKKALEKLPIVGWASRFIGDVAVQAGNRDQVLATSAALLKSGVNIMVFPEGTRSTTGLIQDLKDGYFKLAVDTGSPILPCLMVGSEKCWPTNTFKMGCGTATLVVGSVMYGKDVNELKAMVRERMHALKADLPKGVLSPTDPLVTGDFYPWFKVPKELQHLSREEQFKALTTKKRATSGVKVLF